jgi:hypothetical protein
MKKGDNMNRIADWAELLIAVGNVALASLLIVLAGL